MIGAGVAGILVGSFYALGVVFARQIGLSVTEAALFMSTVVVLGRLAATRAPNQMSPQRKCRAKLMSIARDHRLSTALAMGK